MSLSQTNKPPTLPAVAVSEYTPVLRLQGANLFYSSLPQTLLTYSHQLHRHHCHTLLLLLLLLRLHRYQQLMMR